MVEDLYFCFCCVSVLPAIKCTLFSLPLQTRVRVLSDIRCINSKINLIDLAGSERLSKTGVSSGRNVSVQGWAGQSSTSWRWNCRAFHNRAQPVTQALLVYLLFIISPHREGPQPSALIRSSWFSSLFHEPQCKSAALGHSRQALRAETFLELSTDLHRSHVMFCIDHRRNPMLQIQPSPTVKEASRSGRLAMKSLQAYVFKLKGALHHKLGWSEWDRHPVLQFKQKHLSWKLCFLLSLAVWRAGAEGSRVHQQVSVIPWANHHCPGWPEEGAHPLPAEQAYPRSQGRLR